MTVPNQSGSPAIQVRGLVRRYGGLDGLHGLDLSVSRGACYGLFGRNGAGKSTTLKCLVNLLAREAGSVDVLGYDPARDECAVKSRVGYVPEMASFPPWMTAREVLRWCASYRPGSWNFRLEAELLARFRLATEKPVQAMSKGMRSQLSLLVALAPEPELLLLDEPTDGLDPLVRQEFLDTIGEVFLGGSGSARRTVLVSTHVLHEWEELVDGFVLLDAGRQVLEVADRSAVSATFRRLDLRYAEPPADEFLHAMQQTDVCVRRAGDGGRRLVAYCLAFEPAIQRRFHLAGPPLTVESRPLTLEETFIAAMRREGISAPR